MDQSYNIIATAIHKPNSIFANPTMIVYKNTNIDLSQSVQNLIRLFKINKYTIHDLHLILDTCIPLSVNLSSDMACAMRHIIYRNYDSNIKMKNKYAKLKKNYIELEDKNNMLQSQNNTLIQTCNNVCKIVCDNNAKIENNKLRDILDTYDL